MNATVHNGAGHPPSAVPAMLWLLLVFLPLVAGRLCVHDQKGWCEGHDIWGWCFHNKTDGSFNCDETNFCVEQENLKNKKSSGCFIRDNSTVCCCNEADGCNLGFIQQVPKYASSQSCYNAVEEPGGDLKLFKPCDDPWCFAFLSTDADGGLTSVVRGCHARKLVTHHMFLEEDKKFHNNTKWHDSKDIAAQPSCDEIAGRQEAVNGTQSLCYDFEFTTEEGDPKKGRLCCCKGEHKCNEAFSWTDESIDKEELEKRKAQMAETSVASPRLQSLLILGLFFVVYC